MRVLLLEDNPADARLMFEAFDEIGIKADLDHVPSVQEAKEYVDRCIADASKEIPSVAILDIRLPAGSGIDVLRHIRAHRALAEMPVLMLTTSDRSDDIAEAKRAGATTYYIKPPDLAGFLDLVRELEAFWLERPGALSG